MQLREETVKKFRLAKIGTRDALPVQHSNQLTNQLGAGYMIKILSFP